MPRAGRANKAAHELEQDAVFVRAPRCPSCLAGASRRDVAAWPHVTLRYRPLAYLSAYSFVMPGRDPGIQ
ncbi:hypothetical protein AUC69_10075 [Methyloceanibacter superfactus]|uniref:Uncharacterized protein n=1 Tax=Methyloceanibacter superfactus TaxID=1774969 RepID=A0A1E3VXF3_9HYPH|nr:hypothetical protein AUC69_10075 [Methyloceanibacter superfactus]